MDYWEFFRKLQKETFLQIFILMKSFGVKLTRLNQDWGLRNLIIKFFIIPDRLRLELNFFLHEIIIPFWFKMRLTIENGIIFFQRIILKEVKKIWLYNIAIFFPDSSGLNFLKYIWWNILVYRERTCKFLIIHNKKYWKVFFSGILYTTSDRR